MPPDFSRENTAGGWVAGIDEAGRGPWAGPVVAAAVILDADRLPAGINDSKQLSAQKREAVYLLLQESALAIGVGISTVAEIDQLNILGATKLAMRRAYDALSIMPVLALVDGNQLPDLPCPMQKVVRGDALSLSIAAASVIAKVTRDRIMRELAQAFPHYGWERNAGYGTRVHQEAIAREGITPHHRRSFAPIRALVEGCAA